VRGGFAVPAPAARNRRETELAKHLSKDSTLIYTILMAQEISSEKKFVRVILPWLAVAGALIAYLVTLNHWVSISSLTPVARVSGWAWQPELYSPLYWLITYPFRWLPAKLIPLGLNLLSALCGALTLGLLARSVALLPHDRTEDQRTREKSPFALLSIRTAWLPPLFAVIVCGFQITFWEHATAASSEMFDLLLFAYVIRCLLEFRINGKESLLLRASIVYGAAMTGNWAMIGFFPLFLVALVWTQGVGFFNARFLGRMFLFGLAGLSLYLLLPMVASLIEGTSVSFWQALRANLVFQKQWLLGLPFSKSVLLHGFDQLHGDRPLWVVALPSLLPVLVMAIRWPSYFGDPSKLGVSLTTFIFHFVHVVLLVVCAWVALDPEKFSPRNLLPLPLLTFYYLGALALGYYCGYFLLVFGTRPAGRPRPVPFYQPLLNRFVLLGLWVVAVLVPVLLISRNLPQIHVTNGPLLRQYTSLLEESLPSHPSFALCDDPTDLLLTQSALSQDGRTDDCVLLETDALKWPDYHRFLRKKQPALWPSNPPKDRKQLFGAPELIGVVYKLTETNTLYYLHPSFGYYFEIFYPEAHGLVCRLAPYPTNTLIAPGPNTELITQNERFWGRIDAPILQPLSALVRPPPQARDPSLLDRIAGWARLSNHPSSKEAIVLAKFYSRALNWWGVQLQQHGHLSEAATNFARAVELKPDTPVIRGNMPAQVNLQFNNNLRAGNKTPIQFSKVIEEQFDRYQGSWDAVLRENGPFDEPSACFLQGREFTRGGNYRQAAQQFARVSELAPDNLASRLTLAYLEISLLGMPDAALNTLSQIQSHPDLFSLDRTNWNTLTTIAVSAHLAKGDITNAEKAVQTALNKYPDDEAMLGIVTRLYIKHEYFSNALQTLEYRLKMEPDDPGLLVDKGFACMKLKAFDEAIQSLNRVVDSEVKRPEKEKGVYYAALFNRALAFLQSGKLDQAQHDYEILQRAFPTRYEFYYGLGEIAYKKQDTNSAIRFCTLYLANVPNTNASEAISVMARLDELKRGVAARRNSR
jgi:Flp pilus assembly protein TadD